MKSYTAVDQIRCDQNWSDVWLISEEKWRHSVWASGFQSGSSWEVLEFMWGGAVQAHRYNSTQLASSALVLYNPLLSPPVTEEGEKVAINTGANWWYNFVLATGSQSANAVICHVPTAGGGKTRTPPPKYTHLTQIPAFSACHPSSAKRATGQQCLLSQMAVWLRVDLRNSTMSLTAISFMAEDVRQRHLFIIFRGDFSCVNSCFEISFKRQLSFSDISQGMLSPSPKCFHYKTKQKKRTCGVLRVNSRFPRAQVFGSVKKPWVLAIDGHFPS